MPKETETKDFKMPRLQSWKNLLPRLVVAGRRGFVGLMMILGIATLINKEMWVEYDPWIYVWLIFGLIGLQVALDVLRLTVGLDVITFPNTMRWLGRCVGKITGKSSKNTKTSKTK